MKLLLHMCCGPCAVYPVSVIKEENIDFEGYFYNPNIHPIEEFERRMENVKIFSEKESLAPYKLNSLPIVGTPLSIDDFASIE